MKNLFRSIFTFCLFVFLFTSLNVMAAPKTGEEIRYLPVQNAGRIKPFDTFAKETLELVYGKTKYKRESGSSQPAYLVVLTWILSPESWANAPLFEVTHLEVKNKLKLAADKKYFTGDEIFQNTQFANIMQELADKRESKEKLTPYFQALQRLENQLFTFRELASGRLLQVLPSPNSDTWISVAELPADMQPLFVDISQNVARYLGAVSESAADKIKTAGQELDTSVLKFKEAAKNLQPVKYQAAHKVAAEVLYNDVHPFRWAYVCYLIASLILLFVWIRGLSKGMTLVWIVMLAGFFIHTLGFAFRVYLAERPPVSNMYETVVWVSWGVVLFAIILEKIYKFKSLLFAGGLVGLIAMIVADSAPAILDPSLQPLEAVLRSNYWLIVHVMTITISYSAFALAFGLGDMALIYFAINEVKYKEEIQKIVTGIYRAMQIGVAFLAPGIILGGIWADYSWGRFWGWDPKETWALIVLLGYIIILHARLVGWIKNFGMAIVAVTGFNLVIMAWYGVNFILGAGLHSYGFGAGGVEYVSLFVLLHLLFVGYVVFARKLAKKSSAV